MTRSDVIQLLAGCLGAGLFYAGFAFIDHPVRWLMLLGFVVSAAMIWGPVGRHGD